ncbi:G-type lectin S-receptor-like serine/threonine-protein kinase [Acorus calamus]|uniref:G-type lectin S-receptor-like serine/threonine-protein kinase n=1 Tax=Acorus calamus TaxID=4465 RepID=A0AAV9CBK0_ACOCL|nr:G-type lectin S-receptor-like serine/threonine-protein kinase [Acorus calamus]
MWVSDNGTFGFGFTSTGSPDELQLSIWYFNLPGDPTIVWSAKRDSPVGREAYVELETTGNLALIDPSTATIVWASNTTGRGVRSAEMSDSGNFILCNSSDDSVWESFSHPSDTLLPGQPLTANPSSLSLSLSYISPNTSLNYSYWSGPQISNATGDVVAVLNDSGSFGVSYGSSSSGTVYVHKNDCDVSGCTKKETGVVLRRLVIGDDGNLRLYRWDVNGLENNKTNVSCTLLTGLSPLENYCTHFEMEAMPQTKYYFSESLVIANFSNVSVGAECEQLCMEDCECVASVFGLDEEEETYCWKLRDVLFGGLQDPSSTLFVKVVRMLERAVEVEVPPMPQAMLELVEEGLDHVYKAMMRRDFGRPVSSTSFAINAAFLSSQATCSYSTMSPR